MKDESKGIYKIKTKNDNFPDGKIEYDFNNINGFSAMKVNKFLLTQQYVMTSSINDTVYNACLFAIASNQDMEAIMSLGMADFNSISYLAMGFFTSGLGAESESITQAKDTENQS